MTGEADPERRSRRAPRRRARRRWPQSYAPHPPRPTPWSALLDLDALKLAVRSALPEPAEDALEQLDADEDAKSGERQHERGDQVSQPDQRAEGSQHPDDRRGGDAGDEAFAREDDAAAHEPDAAHDLSEHSRRVGLVAHGRAERDEDRGAEADQNAGSNSGRLAPKLSLDADGAAAQDGRAEVQPEDPALGV